MISLGQRTKEVATNELRFVYDGWNLTLNSQLSTLNSFAWGLDLSGSMQGAGGIGGLLWVNNGSASTHFVSYDGNGNVAALVNAADGSESARYEYGPFGEVIRASGPAEGSMVSANPFRFSTKYQDDESDLLYYGYRYFNASTGRWISRDPIAERGGMNLYGFVGNEPIALFDYLGLLKPGDVINTEHGKSTMVRPANSTDRDLGNKALCLTIKLIGDLYTPPWNDVWIADMPVEGLNYRGGLFDSDKTEYIFIDQSKVPGAEWQLNAMVGYGLVLGHESDHYFADSYDPETGQRINKPGQDAALKALAKGIGCKYCIYTKGFWRIRNQLEQYACDCGIDLSQSPGRSRQL